MGREGARESAYRLLGQKLLGLADLPSTIFITVTSPLARMLVTRTGCMSGSLLRQTEVPRAT